MTPQTGIFSAGLFEKCWAGIRRKVQRGVEQFLNPWQKFRIHTNFRSDSREYSSNPMDGQSIVVGYIPNAACGINANSPYRRSFWQIDKNNVGILPQTVEHDLLAIGSDIERSHRRVLSEMRELARPFRRDVENPEVLNWVRALHVNETIPTGQESHALAVSRHVDVRPFDPCAIRAHGQQGCVAPSVSACIHDDSPEG